jgi:hypothetical protein
MLPEIEHAYKFAAPEMMSEMFGALPGKSRSWPASLSIQEDSGRDARY